MVMEGLEVERQRTEEQRKKPRSDKGKVKVTARDKEILTFVGQQYAITLDQLQLLLAKYRVRTDLEIDRVSRSAALKVVNRWKAFEWVEYEPLSKFQENYIWLSAKGLKALGFEYRYRVPSQNMGEHYFWVTQVRLYFMLSKKNQGRFEGWIPERELDRENEFKVKGEKYTHLADGELFHDGRRIAIEVELTKKDPQTLKGIFTQLADRYERVYYFVSDFSEGRVNDVLATMTDKVKAKFQVFKLSMIHESLETPEKLAEIQ